MDDETAFSVGARDGTTKNRPIEGVIILEVFIGLLLLILILFFDGKSGGNNSNDKYNNGELLLIAENDGTYTVYDNKNRKDLYRGDYSSAQQYIALHTL